jgi:phosphate starvation-inducible PhoH-like protein
MIENMLLEKTELSIAERKRPKGEIKFKLQLTEEQKEATRHIHENKVVALHGVAGTSKTFVAVRSALNMFFKKEVNKIYILRPAVPIEDIGYLKGSAEQKLQYYFLPIIHNMYQMYDKVKIDKMIAENDIEIMPLGFIQGITVNDFLIVDESENVTELQMRMILSRLGKTGRIVFTGDTDQIALKDYSKSGFKKLIDLDGKIGNFKSVELLENYRDPFVRDILKLY